MTNAPTPAGMAELTEAVADRDWWNAVGSIVGMRVTGWDRRFHATLVDGQKSMQIPDWFAERLLAAQPSAEAEAVDRVMAVLNHWFDGALRVDRNSEMVAQLATLAQPDSGWVVEALREAIPDLSSVIAWLDNGCDPKHAADELRIYKSSIDHAALAPVAAEGGETGITVSDEMVETACSRFVSESDDIWPVSVWPESPYDDGSRGDQGRVRLLSDDDQHNVRAAMRLALTDALSALRTEPTGGGEGA